MCVTDKGEVIYSLVKNEPQTQAKDHDRTASGHPADSGVTKTIAIRESLEGAKPQGLPNADSKTNYFPNISQDHLLSAVIPECFYRESRGTGSPIESFGDDGPLVPGQLLPDVRDNWRSAIPAWQEVSLGKVYDNIEVRVKAHGNNIEKIFNVLPTGSAADIKVRVDGAKSLAVSKTGALEIETALGKTVMTKPLAFQEIDGRRIQVASNYIIQDS